MSTVHFEIAVENFSSPFVGLSDKNPFKIEENIISIDFCDNSGAQSMLKCLKRRGVT